MTPSRPLSRAVLTLAFAATGVCVALPGALLPALLRQWSMHDARAGFLFFLAWTSSNLGALLVRGSRARALAIGCLRIAIAASGMAFGVGWLGFVAWALYGLGLGMSMTAISLLQASRNAAARGRELNRLNLFWALGASLGPILAAHALQVRNVHGAFLATAAFFLLVSLWAALMERDTASTAATQPTRTWPFSLRAWPLVLVVLVALPGAVESSLGGWLATYMHRTSGVIALTVSAGTCFWGGMLLSRAISSTALITRIGERNYLLHSLQILTLGALLLLLVPAEPAIVIGAFLAGFGLGPVYPLLLALALPYSENPLIFAIGGLGSAILPWVTGILSQATNSLRIGLAAPVLVAVTMLLLALRLPKQPTPEENSAK